MQLISKLLSLVAISISLVAGIHDSAAGSVEKVWRDSPDRVISGMTDRPNLLLAQFPPIPPFQGDQEDFEEDAQDCLDEDDRDDREECLEDLHSDRDDDREDFEEDAQDCLDEDVRDDRRNCLEDLRGGNHNDRWNSSRPGLGSMNLPRLMP